MERTTRAVGVGAVVAIALFTVTALGTGDRDGEPDERDSIVPDGVCAGH